MSPQDLAIYAGIAIAISVEARKWHQQLTQKPKQKGKKKKK